jgi:plastocyanin
VIYKPKSAYRNFSEFSVLLGNVTFKEVTMKHSLLKKKKLAMLALVLATSLTFAACSPASKTSQSSLAPEAEDLPATVPPDNELLLPDDENNKNTASSSGETGILDPATNVRMITIEAGSFYFEPNVIRVKKGEKVKLVLNSVDMMHDFTVDELEIKAPVTKSGESSTVEFTATTAGTFEYYCSVGQHRTNGQVGTLIVE